MVRTPSPNQRVEKYTAVIFVHGMGPQARHENLGQLLEALEGHYEHGEDGVLRSFKSRTEPSRAGEPDDVAFMQFDRFEPLMNAFGGIVRWRHQGRYRAYEAYWSPVTARGAPGWRVALWALRRLAKPDEIARRSWREATKLRIARLHRLRAETGPIVEPVQARGQRYVEASLLAFVRRFRGAEGARFQLRHPGRPMDAKAFTEFAVEKLDASWSDRVKGTVRAWDATRLRVEILASRLARHIYRIGAAGALLAALMLWQLARSGGTDNWAWVGLGALGLALTVLIVGGGKFLSVTFSDVFIWNSNQDRDREFRRRQEILAKTRALFEHVASDANCKRMVIVAHSLGTAIALESLSLMGRRNAARQGTAETIEISKLSHLFTLGSPIDKIFYFFHTREEGSYRANRLYDDLRGDLSQEPFFRDGRQRVRWLNIWDRIDIVSDPLFTPLGDQTDGGAILSADIENCAVENTKRFAPIKSHTAYLANDEVVESVAAALFRNDTYAPKVSVDSGRAVTSAFLRALHRMVGWYPAALLVSTAMVWIGGTRIAIAVALTPILGFLLEGATIAMSARARAVWTAFKSRLGRGMLKARMLVAAPRGD